MDLREFKEIKKSVDETLAQAHLEALDAKVPVFSKEYREAKAKLKTLIVEKSGVDARDYAYMEKSYFGEEGFADDVRKNKISDLAQRLFHLGKK